MIYLGNIEIVVELLKSGYRSLEAKNQEGQTAVHLACHLSQNDILEKLIARGANVNCRDSEGNTPLHVSRAIILSNYTLLMILSRYIMKFLSSMHVIVILPEQFKYS